WPARYAQLAAYHADHGHCTVPLNWVVADGTRLGRWVAAQRRHHKLGELDDDKVAKLDALGFDSVLDGEWDAYYDALGAYFELHGDLRVKDEFRTPAGARLGVWINAQRRAWKAGDLGADRVKMLAELGFEWKV
ncbi:helicase associated domain-containing protein, partial [Pelagophyceae sp. CCMP2097]